MGAAGAGAEVVVAAAIVVVAELEEDRGFWEAVLATAESSVWAGIVEPKKEAHW